MAYPRIARLAWIIAAGLAISGASLSLPPALAASGCSADPQSFDACTSVGSAHLVHTLANLDPTEQGSDSLVCEFNGQAELVLDGGLWDVYYHGASWHHLEGLVEVCGGGSNRPVIASGTYTLNPLRFSLADAFTCDKDEFSFDGSKMSGTMHQFCGVEDVYSFAVRLTPSSASAAPAPDETIAPAGETVAPDHAWTLDKAVGDILISDPDKRRGVVDILPDFFDLIRSLSQEDRTPAWRVWEQPEPGTIMKDQMQIKTKIGMAALTFSDGTRFILRRGSEMEISRGRTGALTTIKILKGAGYYLMPNGKRVDIMVPSGRIGVRGTTFSLTVTEEAATVRLIEGSLEIAPATGGSATTIEAGQQIDLTPSGLSAPTGFDAAVEQASWQAAEAELPDTVTSIVEQPDYMPLALLAGLGLALFALIVVFIVRRRRRRRALA